MQSATHLKGETIDGYQVRIFANLEGPAKSIMPCATALQALGLFRTEYLLFKQLRFPTEEEQAAIYRKMAQRMQGRPLVIRIYDVGGDKKFDFDPASADAHYFSAIGDEPNPAMGCRAIRFLTTLSRSFRCPASSRSCAPAQYGEVHILIPMVSDISELRFVRARVQNLSREMRTQGSQSGPLDSYRLHDRGSLQRDALRRDGQRSRLSFRRHE